MVSQRLGRNDPCPCGSGKKYKKCCEGKVAVRQSVPQVEVSQFVALFHAGRYVELESQSQASLKWGMVWKILGTALGIQGKIAIPVPQKAAQFLPNDAEVQNNLGIVFKDLGQFEVAAGHYRNALTLSPQYVSKRIGIASPKACGTCQISGFASPRHSKKHRMPPCPH